MEISAVQVSNFYPRPPCGGRRAFLSNSHMQICISIHALRAEGDVAVKIHNARCKCHFYPRPPCGGRQAKAGRFPHTIGGFLSTPSVRRATTHVNYAAVLTGISIHALRAEGDRWPSRPATRRRNFYPRPPCGGRPVQTESFAVHSDFYPRPPCGGRRFSMPSAASVAEFLSTPSVRRATCTACLRI